MFQVQESVRPMLHVETTNYSQGKKLNKMGHVSYFRKNKEVGMRIKKNMKTV